MTRKWTVLAATVGAVALLTTGITIADDENSPVHKIMEKVQKDHNAITKALRTPVAFKKAQKDIATKAEELAKLGKEARAYKEPAAEQKQPYEKWTALMDDFVTASENFAKEAGKDGIQQPQAKAAYKSVQQSCSACHMIFRKDED